MSLLTFRDARAWLRAIGTRVSNGSMPPWHADPSSGPFLNDLSLSAREKDTILQWVKAGGPEGDPKDLPTPPTYAEGWSIGKPDAVLSMQEDYPLPAEGVIPYQYFEVATNFTEDKWLQAYEIRPGNRPTVHHVIVYARPPARPQPYASAAGTQAPPPRPRPEPIFTFAPNMEVPAGQTGGPALPEHLRKPLGPNDRPNPGLGPSVGGFVPGNATRVYRPGTAIRLAAGSTLVFQMHYTTIGKPTTDRTKIGLIFADGPPKTTLIGTVLANGGLHIKAGDANARVDAEMTINRDMTLWSVLPHTHVRGKRWLYEATFPDGRKQTLLSVPNYDFEWQHEYVYTDPVKLPKGTVIHATAWYDNSTANKSNPDATKDVWWGDQTFEEMMFTGLTLSLEPSPAPATGQQ
ncbi:MAG: thiol-disulfide isomerase [Acidimicrobiia bacterium]|nr:thiol-disulfide isomerase [Acidimicrobiia bacterium]